MKTIWIFLFLLVSASLGAQVPRLVVPIGHTEPITSVAFSPDGQYVLTGSWDKTAKLWNLEGQEILTFGGHFKGVTAVAFSPDGKYVLTGSLDNTARLWDLTGRTIRSFDRHAGGFFDGMGAVAFSPNGKLILTGYSDSVAILWDYAGKQIQSFTGHTSYINSLAFSPNSRYVLTGSADNTAILWNLSGKKIQVFKGHSVEYGGGVTAVSFSPDGKLVLTAGADHTAKLWDLEGRNIRTFSGHADHLRAAVFSPDGKYILTGSEDQTAKLWDLDGRQLQAFSGDLPNGITSVAFSPDGKLLLTGSWDHTARLWSPDGKAIQKFSGTASGLASVTFSPDGKLILTGNWGKTAHLWDIDEKKIHTCIGHTEVVYSAVFSPDGKSILTGSWDKTAKLWNLQGKELQTFNGHSGSITSVDFSPDGKYVLTGSLDNMVKMWGLNGREIPIFKFKKQSHWISSVAFSPDGESILTGSADTAKLWNLQGEEIQAFIGHSGVVDKAIFSPDGKSVLTGSRDNTARLWNLQGQEIRTFKGHYNRILALAFSPDGKYILTGSLDNSAKLWDLHGNEIQTFIGHSSAVTGVAFSSNGKYVLTGSEDNTAKLWSPVSGNEIATLVVVGDNDWVVTTPSGLFNASPGAIELMHYILGLEVIELEQLKERYYEPGLLAKIMGSDKFELRNVTAFNKVTMYPALKASIEKGHLMISLTERTGGLGKLTLFINGKEIREDLNPERQKKLDLDLSDFAKYYLTDTNNILTLRAYNDQGWLKSRAYKMIYRPAAPKSADKPAAAAPRAAQTIPYLYAIVIGSSDYPGSQLDLRFADQDATAMSLALQQACSALFGKDHTSIRLLSTAGKTAADIPSKANIRQAFVEMAAKARPADLVVVYFSGHGLAYGPAEKEQFYYLTKDIGSEDLSDPIVRDNYTISSNELTQWLTAIPAQKQVVIIDACSAGKLVASLSAVGQRELNPSQVRALERMKDRTGTFVLTGSASDKVSYEASPYGQGLLTYSLLQGMRGLALSEGNRVDVMTLFQYVCNTVPELAKNIGGIQTPVLAFPNGGASFDIGIVNEPLQTPLAPGKPVFVRSIFLEAVEKEDLLGLADTLETYFRERSAKDAEPEIVYMDVREFPNAYSIRGLYTFQDDRVTLTLRLYQGKIMVGEEFEVTGKKNDVPGLAENIAERVLAMIKR